MDRSRPGLPRRQRGPARRPARKEDGLGVELVKRGAQAILTGG
jgi:hypothetical protein